MKTPSIDDIFQIIDRVDARVRALENGRRIATTVDELPPSPYGQQVCFQDAAMATAGVRWYLDFDKASGLWQFTGGGWLSSSLAVGGTAFTSGTYQTSGQAALTLPALSGAWEFQVSATLQSAGAGANNILVGLFDDGSVIWDPAVVEVASGIFDGGSRERTRVLTGVAGGSVMNLRYKTLNAVSSNATELLIRARPAVVS